MHIPSAAELLAVWERGRVLSLPEWALAVLGVACPEVPAGELQQWSIGRRDAALLSLRESVFGPHLSAVANCPACDERLELSFEADDIRAPDGGSGLVFEIPLHGYTLLYRLPATTDLSRVALIGDLEAARRSLLGSCVLQARNETGEVAFTDLPDPLLDELGAAMALNDAQADVELALTCERCGHVWQCAFDIVAYLWRELSYWCRRLLREVHTLAQAYGWAEAEILALSPWRRAAYLELASA